MKRGRTIWAALTTLLILTACESDSTLAEEPLPRVDGAPTEGAHRSFPRITVLVADWCPYCRALESDLKRRSIPYTRLDIESDQKGQQLYVNLGGGGIPITLIGSKVIQGYQPAEIFTEIERKLRRK